MIYRPSPRAIVSILLLFAMTMTWARSADPAVKKKAPNPVFAPINDREDLPRVLLIGDSISMGYTLPVREGLAGKANVHRPPANCGSTISGLAKIETWLKTVGEEKTWDVIHFNWGLHDLKYVKADGQTLTDQRDPEAHPQVTLEEYRDNLNALVQTLKATGAKLIWRNTTPVPEGASGRISEDVPRYNEVAAEIMKREGIPTHDLYSFALERLTEIQRPANVHFTPEGSAVLAADVVRVILETLNP